MAEPHWPLALAGLGSIAYVALVQAGAYSPVGNSTADGLFILITGTAAATLSLVVGLLSARVASLVGVLLLTAALQWNAPDPFPAMIIVGLWLVGRLARSHRRLSSALRVRVYELESGREVFIEEALRYERMRIARELHDIVAHSLSVIVIQASAGQRLADDDPRAPNLLDSITDIARQLRGDLDGMAQLLSAPTGVAPLLSRPLIDELVTRAAATGSPVTCHLDDDLDRFPGGAGAVVYRLLQEGLTNAIKHAQGAPIEVTVASAGSIYVAITNEPPGVRSSAPAVPGARRGLAGLAERVNAANGTFTSGPTPEGGWQITALLPI